MVVARNGQCHMANTSSTGSRMGRMPIRLKMTGHQPAARPSPATRAAVAPKSRLAQRKVRATSASPR